LDLRLLIAGAAALVGTAGLAQPAPQKDQPAPSCEGELFQFRATGAGHATKVTLCGKKGATSAELVTMFKNAVGALEANDQLDSGRRAELVTQIKGKIAQIEGQKTASSPPPAAPSIAPLVPRSSVEALKPKDALGGPPSEYSALPPLPPPLPPATTSVLAAATSLPPLEKPRLTIDCFNAEDLAGAGPCESLERETRLTVRAGGAVPAGTTLRFMRRGDFRAEVDLAQLAAGKSMQFTLPRQVCAGVVESKVEIQVVRRAGAKDSSGQVVDSMGPYLLRC
jgi:hypothetical protein